MRHSLLHGERQVQGAKVGITANQGLFGHGSAVLLAAFALIESRHRAPLLPLRLLRSRTLVGANAVMLLFGSVSSGMPFLLTQDGVHCEEIAPHEEHGETWRVLKVTFPPSIHVHCAEQKFYFNEAGYQVRNDYAPDVSHSAVAHYTFDHKNFDGFIFPTYRRVVRRDPDGRTHQTAPTIFRLDLESAVLSRD